MTRTLPLVLIAVALLAWTFRRRPFGRVGAVLLRSAGALLIGLGALPADDPVLAALAAGVPVGIAVARVSRTPPPAALAGALLGASLVRRTPLVAVGAVAGANLAVIAFELLAARRRYR